MRRELNRLEVLLDAVEGGAGHVCALVGEKGEIVAEIIGKNRHNLLLYFCLLQYPILTDHKTQNPSQNYFQYDSMWGQSILFCLPTEKILFYQPYYNINMFSNSTTSGEQQISFSNPETLEQLRQQLLSVALEQHHSSQSLSQQLANLHPIYNELSNLEFFPLQCETFQQIQLQLNEKSNCIASLSHLSVRMIECILEQQLQNQQLLSQYEETMENLREQNECLTSRNYHIENDVEYFREHLRAAESQLENITSIKDEQGNVDDYREMEEKDRRIEILEEEMERIKGELQFFKFNSRSKKSIGKFSEMTLSPMKSQQNLALETEIEQYQRCIIKLQAQNEQLRRQIHNYNVISAISVRSRKNSTLNKQIKQQLIEQTERGPFQKIKLCNQKQYCSKASSLSNLHKIDFKESLESPRSNAQMLDEETGENAFSGLRMHALSSQWSTKSFQYRHEVKQRGLIHLNQEDEEGDLFLKNVKCSAFKQQTKQTEESIKQAEIILKASEKTLLQVGVNTEIQTLQTLLPPPKFNPKSFFQTIKNWTVNNRIKKSITKANQSLHLMIY